MENGHSPRQEALHRPYISISRIYQDFDLEIDIRRQTEPAKVVRGIRKDAAPPSRILPIITADRRTLRRAVCRNS